MSQAEPILALLSRGDVLGLTSLRYDQLRSAMLEALHDLVPTYTRLEEGDPGVALVDALAACAEVMGFYHDRILTESKLGSALLLESVTRLGEVVGYRPLPPIAAVAYQFFYALEQFDKVDVLAGTKVSGTLDSSSSSIVFETRSTLTISPAFNRMALSRLIDRYAGALRVVIQLLNNTTSQSIETVLSENDSLSTLLGQISDQQGNLSILPLNDFRSGTLALINGKQGLELCSVASSRLRGIALGGALVRSYDAASTVLSRATCIRHLRFWRPLDSTQDVTIATADASADQVVFEITDRPILHRPDPTAPEQLISTLEVFVFDTQEEIGDPTQWDAGHAWQPVFDFSGSEAADRHYRVIVDDRLTSYLVLRRRLGYRVLLDDFALSRVYVRFVPAIGRVYEPSLVGTEPLQIADNLLLMPTEPSEAAPTDSPGTDTGGLVDLGAVTLQLDGKYFQNAMVRPKVKDATVRNATTWAVISDDIGLKSGEQIAIQSAASGKTYFRTLASGTQGRRLNWYSDAAATGIDPANNHDPIDEAFDATKTTLARLSDIASGQAYPLWLAFYKQAKNPDAQGTPWTGTLPMSNLSASTQLLQYLYVKQGTLFLILEDSSNVKSGDYLLIGRKLRRGYRQAPPDPDHYTPPSNPDGLSKYFERNCRHPWLTAEVVQAVEVQGNLVRLKEAISQDYVRDRLGDRWVTDVVVVPAVASVFFGDFFLFQHIRLDETEEKTFTLNNVALNPDYLDVPLKGLDGTANGLSGPDLWHALGWELLTPEQRFAQLFLAVAGQVVTLPDLSLSAAVTIPSRGLLASQLSHLELESPTDTVSSGPFLDTGTNEITADLEFSKVDEVLQQPPKVLLAVVADSSLELYWDQPVAQVPNAPGTYWARDLHHFLPTPSVGQSSVPELDPALLRGGGRLIIKQASRTLDPFTFAWPTVSGSTTEPGLLVDTSWPSDLTSADLSVTAIALPATAQPPIFQLSTGDVKGWSIDWDIPTRFTPNAWQKVADTCVFASGTQATGFAQVSYTGDGQLSPVNLPVVDGSPLEPLANVSTIWALPSADPISVSTETLTAVWQFPVTDNDKTILSTWDGVLVIKQNDVASVVSDAEVVSVTDQGQIQNYISVDLVNDFRDFRSNLQSILAMDKLDASQQRVWVVDQVDASGLPSGATLSVACTVRTQGVDSIEYPELLFAGESKFVFLPTNSLQPGQAFVAALVYPTTPFTDLDTSDPKAIKLSVPADWPITDQGFPQTPASAALVEFNDENSTTHTEIWIISKMEVSEDPDPTGTFWFVFTFGDNPKGTINKVSLGFASWPDPKSPGATMDEVWSLKVVQIPWSDEHQQLYSLSPFKTYSVNLGVTSASDSYLVLEGSAQSYSLPDKIYWSPLSWTEQQPGTLDLQGYTTVQGTSADLDVVGANDKDKKDRFDQLGYLVFGNTFLWQARTVVDRSFDTSGWSLTVSTPPSDLVAAGETSVPVRFVYDIAATQGDTCTLLRAYAQFDVAKLGQLGLPGTLADNEVILFCHQDDFSDFFQCFPDTVDDSGNIKFTENPSATLRSIFTNTGGMKYARALFAQTWEAVSVNSLTRQKLLYLGPAPFPQPVSAGTPITLIEGDYLAFFQDQTPMGPAKVSSVADGGYYVDWPDGFKQVRLSKVSVGVASDAFSAEATFTLPTTTSPLAPYLFTTVGQTSPAKLGNLIGPALLRYDQLIESDGKVTVLFSDVTSLEQLSQDPALCLYVNKADELKSAFYSQDHKGLEDYNLFKSEKVVEGLVVNDDSQLFPTASPYRSVLFCDTRAAFSNGNQSLAYVDSTTGVPEHKQFQVAVVSQSVIFNSGNFIPVLGTDPGLDETTITNALRVWATIDNQTYPVKYDKNQIITNAEQALDLTQVGYYYNFTKLPGGTFVLNFLLIDCSSAEVTVCVEYAAPRLPELNR